MKTYRIHTELTDHGKEVLSLNSIEFRKRRYDSFSYVGILALLATGYYLIFDSREFLTNMEKPYNLLIWVLMLTYPVIRYFFPFHIYIINSKGITLKNNDFLSWKDILEIEVYDNYDEEKDSDTPIYKLELTIKTKEYETKKINFSNYTIANKELLKKIKPFLSKNLKMKDILIKIFMIFYEKNTGA